MENRYIEQVYFIAYRREIFFRPDINDWWGGAVEETDKASAEIPVTQTFKDGLAH